MSEASLISTITKKRTICVGSEQYMPLNSYLIFSTLDDGFYVLPIDVRTNEIITILPVQYWENSRKKGMYRVAGRVTKNKLFQAVMAADKNHPLLSYPPLCGRKDALFLAHSIKENDRNAYTKSAGKIDIDLLLAQPKTSTVAKIRAFYEEFEAKSPAKILNAVICAHPKIGALNDRKLIVPFEKNYETIYRSALSSFAERRRHTAQYPIFDEIGWG